MSTSGERETCPACGSTNVRYAARNEIPDEGIVLYRFRFCKDCTHVYQPCPPSRTAMFRTVLGVVATLATCSFAFDQSAGALTYIAAACSALIAAYCFYRNIQDVIAARREEADSAQARHFNEP